MKARRGRPTCAPVAVFVVAVVLASCAARSRGPVEEPVARPSAVKEARREDVAVAPTPSTPLPSAAAAEDDPRFSFFAAPIEAAIAEGKLPGAVVVVGRHDEILFSHAYGARALVPEREPMSLDTIFDLASLTKVVATTTSLMILVDRGLVDLDARASAYVPELAKLPPFTVRQLLLHTSGLPAEMPLADCAGDRATLFRKMGALTLKRRPGERFVYSDAGFLVLEEIVRRASGTDLAAFAAREIFEPLEMHETRFLPPPELLPRIAPTETVDGVVLRGTVHDPRASALGGIAGHAGLFSTASDMARFAQAMLGKGTRDGHRLMGEATFDDFVARRDTSSGGRALGWDVDSRYATHRGILFSPRAFGHGGFTGTVMWIDPARDLFLVFLSNRVHPDGKGVVNPLVHELSTLAVRASDVRTGIDVLEGEAFARLAGSKIGLVTNDGARASTGRTVIEAFRAAAPSVTLAAIFSPEHGLGANREGKIADGAVSGVPVYSLYGEHLAPTAASLANLDALVVDLPDVGTRFYTYTSTMKLAMKAAAERGLPVFVLDRPNPLGGLDVEGPVNVGKSSFVHHHPLAVRHGMTMGELATMFAADEQLAIDLRVVRAENWRRKDDFDRTGLVWSSPSPNLRNTRGVFLYPMLGLLEGTSLSVGRGTSEPFEIFGAPWLDEGALKEKLDAAELPGVRFEPTSFVPNASVHAGKRCRGLRVIVDDRRAFRPVHAGVVVALALHELHPTEWDVEHVDKLLQNEAATAAIVAGRTAPDVEAIWTSDLQSFVEKRARFLLYP